MPPTPLLRWRGGRGCLPFNMLTNLRLEYRKPTVRDLSFFRAYLSDPLLTRFLPRGEPYLEEVSAAYLGDRIAHWETHGFGTYLLSEPQRSKVVGYCGLEFVPNTPHIDIRYGLIREVWGRGLALEAAQTCLEEGFQRKFAETFYGAAVPQNSASIAVLGRIGMKPCDVDLYGDDVLHFCISKRERGH